MATTINASTSAGLVSTADTSGVLQLQTANTTAVSVSAAQVVSFTNAPTISSLTSGRVTYAGTSGVLQDSANLTFDGNNMTVNGLTVGKGTANLGFNSAVGISTLNAVTTGNYNTAIGYNAGLAITTGGANTCLGYSAGKANLAGDNNVYLGSNAGNSSTAGGNVLIGSGAATNLTTGTNNVVIGLSAQASAVGAANQIVLGQGVTGQADSNVTIGSGAGKIYNSFAVNATWTQTSDGRLKTNVKDDSLGLSFINRLRPVTFTWKASNEVDPSLPYYNEVNQRNTTTVIHGLIAQEVKAALDAEGCTTFNGWDAGNEDTIQAISREMFVSPLIKAIQELSIKLDEANTANSAMAARIAALEAK
jgi:hypothetical protein